MTDAVQLPQGLVKLSGTITNYRCTRTEASFVFTDGDQATMGVIAVAAGIAGLSGQAISTAANAAATEDADYVEFDLDGKQVKGWVWRSPFKNGDEVEVAGEWRDDHLEAAGIARPSNHTIALYPHCSRGRAKHTKNAVKWWLIGTTVLLALGALMFTGSDKRSVFFFQGFGLIGLSVFGYACLALYAFFGLMTFSLARKWMPFVRLAENVFATLGFPNPSNVDLVRSSKAQRKPDDPGEFGTFYFRY